MVNAVCPRGEAPKNGYKGPELLDLMISLLVARSFTEKPVGSNSIEHELSMVNCLMDMRFLIMEGE
jgi:hypothetical protein